MVPRRRFRRFSGYWFITFSMVIIIAGGCAAAGDVGDWKRPEAGPPRALIDGVPFINWGHAASLRYQAHEIVNPSFVASLAMVLQYWDQDLRLLERGEDALPKGPGGWGIVEEGGARSLDDLKRYIARGIPVILGGSALTPVAHPLSSAWFLLATVRGFRFPPRGPESGVVSRMEGLGTMRRIERQLGFDPRDSTLWAARVAIGYDDEAKVMILHDPSFGPAWVVGYDDFLNMWQGAGGLPMYYHAAYPRDPSERSVTARPKAPYPPRTADQLAAYHFMLASAFSSVGRMGEAEKELEAGLRVPGISKGYRHLLLFELAVHHNVRGETERARNEALEAVSLVPEHFRPWELLAVISGSNPEKADAWNKARSLASCSSAALGRTATEMRRMPKRYYTEAQRAVATALARDFFILAGCHGGSTTWLLGPPEAD